MKKIKIIPATSVCTHPQKPILKVIGGNSCCEVTVLACPDCDRYLSEPETDC